MIKRPKPTNIEFWDALLYHMVKHVGEEKTLDLFKSGYVFPFRITRRYIKLAYSPGALETFLHELDPIKDVFFEIIYGIHPSAVAIKFIPFDSDNDHVDESGEIVRLDIRFS